MPSSKKKLKKGVDSLQRQIGLHEEKMQIAKGQDNPELARYYAKEIESLDKEKFKREQRLKKK